MDKKSILVFGVGELQKSIIGRAKQMGLYVVGIDPCVDAVCRNDVDAFEVVGGQDYEGTLAVARKFNISAVVTAATDKPLVMMARIAKELNLPFYSIETAEISTDKYRMKECFRKASIPCANGRLIKCIEEAEGLEYPVILKPRDNSGSRGVIFCRNKTELSYAFNEAIQYTKLDSVLVEEYIEGQEYSIEGLHYNGKSEVIQFTEKRTTPFPYNVELGHIQPANISESHKQEIREIISNIALALGFENCASHTELKINERGIFIIETSPRLGGDYITSMLTPLSTGVNIEEQLLHITLGEDIATSHTQSCYSGIRFFSFEVGRVVTMEPDVDVIYKWPYVKDFSFKFTINERIGLITSSLSRYGHIILQTDGRKAIDDLLAVCEKKIFDMCFNK